MGELDRSQHDTYGTSRPMPQGNPVTYDESSDRLLPAQIEYSNDNDNSVHPDLIHEGVPTASTEVQPSDLPSEVTSEHDPDNSIQSSFWTRRKKIGAASMVLVAAAGLVAGIASANGSEKTKPHTKHAVASPRPQNSSSSSSPVVTSPSTAYAAGNLSPTVPVVVPYIAGESLTTADVEKLVHNIDVAVTKQDIGLLAYSGIHAGSSLATNIENSELSDFQTEKNSSSGLFHYYQNKTYDKDVSITPGQPDIARVLVAATSDFDYISAPDRIKYTSLVLSIGHAVTQLPNGVTEDIYTINSSTASQTTEEVWYHGFSG